MGAITAGELRSQLERGVGAAEAEALAGRIRARVGDEALANGSGQFVDELDVTWADGTATKSTELASGKATVAEK